MEDLYRVILPAFGFKPGEHTVAPLGKGHIHDTYIVGTENNDHPRVILQRVNTYVFRDIEVLMKNMELVTSHISHRNRARGLDPAANGIVLLETEDRNSWIDLGDEGCWRMFWYIENQVTHETAPDREIACEGGRAIADFQYLLSDLDPDLIGDTIPRFHDLTMRTDQFDQSLQQASGDRLKTAEDVIAFTKTNMAQFLEPYQISGSANIPVRITHNDTKFNNILFNREGKSTCMIDLDTVMQGYSWFDFGDALRTCASVAPEDEPDPGKIGFRTDVFRGFAEGYLERAAVFLNGEEIALFHRAPQVFAYMQGLRFLTDYLNGDVYYKIDYPDHNLVRAKSQYTLLERMRDQETEMKAIVEAAI